MNTNTSRGIAGLGRALRDAALPHAAAAHSLAGADGLTAHLPYAAPPATVQW